MPGHTQYTLDTLLQLKDAGLVAASAAATVASVAKIIDLGGAGETEFEVLIDISAIETGSTDEIYTIMIEGSNSATFASGIEDLCLLRVGHATALTGGNDTTSLVGRYRVPGRNERNGTFYRYVRAYTLVVGTIATGINYTAYLCKP